MTGPDLPLQQFTPLANLPTPLNESIRLSERWGISVHLKRDDSVGGHFGGTKLRALEHILWNALEDKDTDLVTVGEATSTQCRLIAALGLRFGLDVTLLLRKESATKEGAEANLKRIELMGATLIWLEEPEWKLHPLAVRRVMKALKRDGKKPRFVPFGCVGDPGSFGILRLVQELYTQGSNRFPYSHVVVPAGSGGTLFGFDLAFQLLPDLQDQSAPSLIGTCLHAAPEALLKSIDHHYIQWNRSTGGSYARSPQVRADGRFSSLSAEDKRLGQRLAIEALGELVDPVYVLPAFLSLKASIDDGTIPPGSKALLLISGPCVNL